MSSFWVRSRIHNPWHTALSLAGETISVHCQGATPSPSPSKPQHTALLLYSAPGCAALRRAALVLLPSGTAKAAERSCVFLKGEAASTSNLGALQMWQQVVVCTIWAHFETSTRASNHELG